jgi:hypothetical protein
VTSLILPIVTTPNKSQTSDAQNSRTQTLTVTLAKQRILGICRDRFKISDQHQQDCALLAFPDLLCEIWKNFVRPCVPQVCRVFFSSTTKTKTKKKKNSTTRRREVNSIQEFNQTQLLI